MADPFLPVTSNDRSATTPLDTEPRNYNALHDPDADDIYRGEPPTADDASSTSTSGSSASSSSSSGSSSSSDRQGGRLGALAAVLELAITRWARNVRGRGESVASSSSSSASSSSSSSSSSASSRSSTTMSRTRRRLRRRSSQASLQTIQSERDILARIGRLKALEQSRQIFRHFILYSPSTIQVPGRPLGAVLEDDARRRVLSTTSISLILNQLELLTSKPRPRRVRGRSRGPPALLHGSTARVMTHSHQTRTDNLRRPTLSLDPPRKPRKGKRRELASEAAPKPAAVAKSRLMPKAWFLDVASPTWEDLRAIGKVGDTPLPSAEL